MLQRGLFGAAAAVMVCAIVAALLQLAILIFGVFSARDHRDRPASCGTAPFAAPAHTRPPPGTDSGREIRMALTGKPPSPMTLSRNGFACRLTGAPRVCKGANIRVPWVRLCNYLIQMSSGMGGAQRGRRIRQKG
jgi:hypothetical protein